MQSFLAVLRTLTDHDVDFIVVGGIAAVLQGAPINTFDLDVVHATDPENVARVIGALKELKAFYRFQPELKLFPDASHLRSPGHQLMMTTFGPVDLLGSIGRGRVYQDLLADSEVIDVAEGLPVRVLGLETQIAVKEEIGAEKDRAVLPILRRVLKESQRSDQ